MTADDADGADCRFTALVLAGRRGGTDPVAATQRLSHKSLARVGGVPMLLRVLRTLAASRSIGRTAVSIEDPTILAAVPGLGPLIARRAIDVVASAATPSLSVTKAIGALGGPWPLLVTTGDHPLLTSAMVDHFCAQAAQTRADLAAAVASASVVLAQNPGARRTFLPFRDDRYTGCNLFALMTPAAADAAVFWRRLDSHRKRPWRVFGAFGPLAILRFVAGGLTLDAGMRAASRRLGLDAVAVKMPFFDAAIDVDKPADLALAENILNARDARGEVPAAGTQPPWSVTGRS